MPSIPRRPTPDRRQLMQLSLFATCLGALPATAVAETVPPAPGGDPARAFDFLVGSWRIHHRRLKDRLAGSTEWVEFDGTIVNQPLMGGLANVSDNVINLPSGSYRGVGLRAYVAKTRSWASWWLDGRDPLAMDTPQIGRFEGGGGQLLADDTFDGKPIKVRVIWSNITARTARWEQAYSADGGKTWETNWYSDFTRAG